MQPLTARAPLFQVAIERRLDSVARRLGALTGALLAELAGLERELDRVLPARVADPAGAAARHILGAGGKRLRPFLCLLAARARPPHGSHPEAAVLARACELVHAATLLHDDVIDLGERRRGLPTARLVFGNAASVLGGDLLLVEALRHVRAHGAPELLDRMLDVLDRMIAAESLQLAKRGRTDLTRDEHFAIVRGKTASLFEWALEAGARTAGLVEVDVERLRAYGAELGVAFQLVDDLLDLDADPDATGKQILDDVRLGTVTLPVLPILDARADLAERIRAAAEGAADESLGMELCAAIRAAGGLEDARREARAHTARAIEALAGLAPTPIVAALDTVASELAERTR